MRQPKRNIRFLTKQEIRKIVDTIPLTKRNATTGYSYPNRLGLRDRALLEVLFSTGLRISECLRLPRDIFHAVIEIGTDTTFEHNIIGKMGYQRVVFFSPVALQALQDYLKHREDPWTPLFCLTARQCQRMVKQRAVEAGITKFVSPHIFRHSLATHLLSRGADLRYVQEFLGHRSITSTQVYTHVTAPQLKQIHKDLY